MKGSKLFNTYFQVMEPETSVGRLTRRYSIIRLFVRVAFHFFYRRIHITGKANIPDGGRLIFAANHQNALMDALSVILTNNYQPVYLARADLFRKPFFARMLGYIKMMPVYRFRDGYNSMGQNEDTFEVTSRVLASGGCIGIMPEGNHGDQKRLRGLKKGIFRIAFRAGELCKNNDKVKIIPVGIDYSNAERFYEELVVNYGKPLTVSDYTELYRIHPQKGINALKNDLSASLQSLIIDVKDEENYETDKLLIEIGRLEKFSRQKNSKGPAAGFNYSRAFCQALYALFEKNPEQAARLRKESGILNRLLNLHGFSPDSMKILGNTSVLISKLKRAICYPLVLTGFLLHILPLSVIHGRLKKVKEAQFLSSFKFVLGLILVPVNYILLAVLFFSVFNPLTATLLLALVPVTGFFAYTCFQYSGKLREVIRFNRLYRENKQVVEKIYKSRASVIELLDPVFNLADDKLK
jgi:1-acyl-sn-glycerol-3-phosphate acyltransferase